MGVVYQNNIQNSIYAITNSAGQLIESYSYDIYGKRTVYNGLGEVINNSKLSIQNYYGFTGRRIDTETGLMYFRARYYSTDLGRFISRDPLTFVDGMNMYAGYFAFQGLTDPTGMCPDPDEAGLKESWWFLMNLLTLFTGTGESTGPTFNPLNNEGNGNSDPKPKIEPRDKTPGKNNGSGNDDDDDDPPTPPPAPSPVGGTKNPKYYPPYPNHNSQHQDDGVGGGSYGDSLGKAIGAGLLIEAGRRFGRGGGNGGAAFERLMKSTVY